MQHSGLAQIYAGKAAADFFGVPVSDPRHPDVFGRVQVGVVYTGGTKIAEHGGDNPADQDVPLVIYAPGVVPPSRVHASVETTRGIAGKAPRGDSSLLISQEQDVFVLEVDSQAAFADLVDPGVSTG